MSVLVIGRFPGDIAVIKKVLSDRRTSSSASPNRPARPGAIHHTFSVGDGFVILVDEWESPEQFEQFFGRADIHALVGEMGASGPPDITITEVIASPANF
jgi:hypothetical protein